ncbi:hypothetical protein [Scopulibacillus cellulosilyticus]|uniref:Spore germination protein GerPA/GerPF n=1 Tax=Scopulibacillus cellulosilyticus TaxID=2665665 RepID=A0ABW2Q2U3_9BACL
MPIEIIYNATNLNSVADNVGIFNGQNQGFGWDNHFKQNNSNFPAGLLITSPANANIIIDNDVIDATINDQDFNPGTILQGL